jgi:xylulokinase
MTMRAVVALDFGTSSVKAAVIALDSSDDGGSPGATRPGAVLALAHAPYPTMIGAGGIVEQDPEHWWCSAQTALRQCAVPDAEIVAVSITGQMQDLVLVGANGRALRPALLYSDLRATAQHERLAATMTDWNARTGNQQDPSNVAAKIAWLSDHEPAVLDEASMLLFGPAAYVLHRAGGAAVCDVITASSTGLLDIHAGAWLGDLVESAGARATQLPRLLHRNDPADSVVGSLGAAAAEELGLPAGIPLVAAFGDAGSATDGLVGTELHRGYLYLGSTGWFAQVVERERLTTATDYLYALLLPGLASAIAIGAVLSAGSAADWARQTFLDGRDFEAVDNAVIKRLDEVGVTGLLCLPGLGGERAPVRDANARVAFVGATAATQPIDFYTAVLTGVAFNLRHAADDMGPLPDVIPVVGGAARSPAWCRILADVFDRPIAVATEAEPGIYSAARHAAAALGFAHVPVPLADSVPPDIVAPSQLASEYARLLPLHRRLYEALGPTFRALSAPRFSTPIE